MTQLEELGLFENKLTTIDNIEALTQLKGLYLCKNQLETIDVKGLTELENLYLTDNKLKTIEVKRLTQLKRLLLSNNRLTSFEGEELTQLIELALDNNQLTTITINTKEFPQLQSLSLSENKLTALTYAKLSSLLIRGLFKFPICYDIMQLAPEEQTKVDNEFNQKVAWTTRQFLIGEQSDVIESELQSQLEEALLLKPEDSVYIINEASIQAAKRIAEQRERYNEFAANDSFLLLLPEFMEEKIIPWMALCAQTENESKNKNESALPALKTFSFCNLI